jgi:hypothetical protein
MSQSLAEHVEIKSGTRQRSRFLRRQTLHFFTLTEDRTIFSEWKPTAGYLAGAGSIT